MSWCNKDNLDLHVWEHIELIELLNTSRTLTHSDVKQLLRKTKHKKHLEELQKEYVLVPADKAGSNIIIVCKKYYVEVVLNELKDGICNQNAYELVDIHVPSVINKTFMVYE